MSWPLPRLLLLLLLLLHLPRLLLLSWLLLLLLLLLLCLGVWPIRQCPVTGRVVFERHGERSRAVGATQR